MATIGESTGNITNSGHRLGQDTGKVNPLHIDQYGGAVESQFVKSSIMREYFTLKRIVGTDTVTNDRIGKTSLQAVVEGVRPSSAAPTFDNISVKVDTVVLARSNVALLHDFQAHYDVRAAVGMEHGKEIGKFFDEAFLIQGIKAAMITVGTGAGETPAPDGFQSGTVITLAAISDENDPDKLQRAVEDACASIEKKDVDLDGAVMFVPVDQYYVLLRNDKLISGDYSTGNGDYAQGTVLRSNGVRIVKTNRIPSAAKANHFLSNGGNGNAYDVSAAEAKAVAVILMPKALLAGETIPLTSDVYYDKPELQWFIDSYLAFGVTPNRPEVAAVVMKKTA